MDRAAVKLARVAIETTTVRRRMWQRMIKMNSSECVLQQQLGVDLVLLCRGVLISGRLVASTYDDMVDVNVRQVRQACHLRAA